MNDMREPRSGAAAAQDNPAQKHFEHVLEQLNEKHAALVAPDRRQDAAALIVEAAAGKGFKATEDIVLLQGAKGNLIAMQGEDATARTASISLNDIKPGEFDRVSQRMSLSDSRSEIAGRVQFPDMPDRGAPERTLGSGGRFASSDNGVTFPPGEDRGEPERTRGSGGRFASSDNGVTFPPGEDRGEPERTRGSGGRFASSDNGVTFPPGEDRGEPERTRGSGGRFASSNDAVTFPPGEDRGEPERTRGSGGRFASSNDAVTFPPGEDRGEPERTRGSGGRFASSDNGVTFPPGEDRGEPERTRGSGGRFAEPTERNDGRLAFAMPEAQADAPSHGSLRR